MRATLSRFISHHSAEVRRDLPLRVDHGCAAGGGFATVRFRYGNRREGTFGLRHGLAVSRPYAGSVPEQDEFSWVHSCPVSPQRGLPDGKENGTANHAKGGGASQGHDDAFDFKARLAEVE
jgi:hypothetical protein